MHRSAWFLLLLAACGKDGSGLAARTDQRPASPSQGAPPAEEIVIADLRDPAGVAVDRAGTIYVAESDRGTIVRLARDGQRTTLPIRFRDPAGLSIDAAGRLLVAERGRGRVVRMEPDGSPTVLAAGITDPRWIAADDSGAIFVSARGLGRSKQDVVLRVAPGKKLALFAEGLRGVQGIAARAGYLYAAAVDGTRRPRAALISVPIRPDGTSGPPRVLAASDELRKPGGLAADARGGVFLGAERRDPDREGDDDADDHEDAARGVVASWAPPTGLAPFATGLGAPRGVAFDAAGNLLVAVSANHDGALLRFRAPAAPVADAPAFANKSPISIDGHAEPGAAVVASRAEAPDTTVATTLARAVDGAFTLSLPLAPNATNSFALRAIGVGGMGLAGPAQQIDILHDDTNPDMSVLAPENGSFARRRLVVTAMASDPRAGLASIATLLDSNVLATSPVTDPAQPTTVTLEIDTSTVADGPHAVGAMATDRAGNAASSAVTVIVDNTPPYSEITLAPAAVIADSSAAISFRAVDNLTAPEKIMFAWRLDGAAFTEFAATDSVLLDALGPGSHTFEVKARDLAGNEEPEPRAVTFRVNRPPSVAVAAAPSSGTAPLTVAFTATASDADGDALVLSWGFGDGTSAAGGMSQVHRYEAPGTYRALVSASDGFASVTAAQTVIVTAPAPSGPPDPATVAPAVATGVATDVKTATGFLYSGDHPVQTAVQPGVIDVQRAAVVRGRVTTRDAAPLPDVEISVLAHPELGRTLSREDGRFDLAVNGGGLLTLDYRHPEHLPAQRQLAVGWQQYVTAPDVALVPVDEQATAIALGSSSAQVARGTLVADADGTRQATLVFAAGTAATMSLPGGTSRALPSIRVRATEYTVGGNGPRAMPATLPPASGYTYAVELSADEALAAGATSVNFDRPVALHVENFLDFPVGTAVPAGFYDREKVAWVPSDNGRVIRIAGVTGGIADVDTVGDGKLASLALDEAERRTLASLYAVGQTLWRVPIRHFSTYDCNWPYGPPPCNSGTACAGPPPGGGNGPFKDGRRRNRPDKDCKRLGASFVSCYGQVLNEQLPLTGTGFDLHYAGDRVPGRKDNYTIRIPLSGPTVSSPPPKRIELRVEVAGRVFEKNFAPQPNLSDTFEWDGRDAYGRSLVGWQTAKVTVGNVYEAVYRAPADFAQSFGLPGDTVLSGSRARQEVTLAAEWEEIIGVPDPRFFNLGGWSVGIHHVYDPTARTLFQGDGERRSAASTTLRLATIAGAGTSAVDGVPAKELRLFDPRAVAVAPDGTIYISDANENTLDNARIWRIGADGIARVAAGTGPTGFSGDGGKATEAQLDGPVDLALGPDGSLYVADQNNFRVRRIDAAGVITTVAGNGQYGYDGDGGPATAATLGMVRSIAVAGDGTLYILEDGSFPRIRRIGPDGIITTFAGYDGRIGDIGENVPATKAFFSQPRGLAAARDGSVYVADTFHCVLRRIGSDGIIKTVAGNGDCAGSPGEGEPALEGPLPKPSRLAVAGDGTVFIASSRDRVRALLPDGRIVSVAGGAPRDPPDLEGAPPTARVIYPRAVALTPDGGLLILHETGKFAVVRAESALGGIAGGELLIPSEDQREVYVFSGSGRHLATVEALTGAPRFQFAYDTSGRLRSITDGDGNATSIERDGAGQPAAIVAPGGQRTALSVDSNSYLERVTDPAGGSFQIAYQGATGLVSSITTPRGHVHRYAYDDGGKVIRAENPAGGVLSLARTQFDPSRYAVAVTTALNLTTTHETQQLPSGDVRRTRTDPGGAQTTVIERPNGTRQVTSATGVTIDLAEGPDPRWGMQSPIIQSMTVKTPGGLTSTQTTSRSAVLGPQGLTSQTDSVVIDGARWTTAFDAATRRITLTTPSGRQSYVALDEKGRAVEEQSDASIGQAAVVTTYDAKGRLSTVKTGPQSWTFAYDASGRLATREDATGARLSWGYDPADRLISATLPGGTSYEFVPDAAGNMLRMALPLASHRLEYSPLDRITGYTPPGNAGYSFAFDADGRMRTVTLPSGRMESHTYDALGRRVSLDLPDGKVEFGYADATARPQALRRSADSFSHALSFTYDGDLITSATSGGAANGQIAWTFGPGGLTSSTFASGADSITTSFTRNAEGKTTNMGPFTVTRGGPARTPTQINDGVFAVQYAYDALGRVATRTHTVAGAAVYRIELAFDSVGRVASRLESMGAASRKTEYVYDADSQIAEVRRDGATAESYGYDANRNRTSRRLGAGAIEWSTYDVQDRLLAQAGVAHDYDADGYLTRRGSDRFTYSPIGELLAATVGGRDVAFAYDALRRRVSRTDAGGTTEYFYGDPGNDFRVTHSRDASGAVSALYHDDGGRLFAFQRGASRFYVATDQLGSPRAVFDSAGATVKTVEYDAFGNVVLDSNAAFELPVGFAGGLPDATIGFVRFGLRDYDPVSGRWTSRDPVLFGGRQTNLYAYVNNNPANVTDPAGLNSVKLGLCEGFCSGIKVAWTRNGLSVCVEMGVGSGNSLEADPFAGLDETGSLVAGKVSVKFFKALKLEAGFEFDDCGNFTPKGEACIGPLCSKGLKLPLAADKDTGEPIFKNPFKQTDSWGVTAPSGKFVSRICQAIKY